MTAALLNLLNILVVLFFFGLCVFIHELGHLLVAMWRGMHIERFSVGFGPAIWKREWRGIEWQVAAIPFGGFVALPQLDPGEQPKSSDGEPLPQAKPVDRILTAAAGPVFNVLLGFLLCTIIWQVGVLGYPYSDSIVIDDVQQTFVDPRDSEKKPTPEAAAGLEAGDEIVAINDKTFTRGWSEAQQMIIFAPQGRIQLDVVRDGERIELPAYEMAPNPQFDGIGYPFFTPRLPNTVGTVIPEIPLTWQEGAETVPAPAAKAGLKAGDLIVSVNGEKPGTTEELVERIQAVGEAGESVRMVVERNGRQVELPPMDPVAVTRRRPADDGETLAEVTRYQIGFAPDNRVMVYPTPLRQMLHVLNMTKRTLARLPDRKNPIRARNMSGPVGIISAMFLSFRDSWRTGLQLVAVISISLAIVNLLPLPVVDGGHCVWGFYELIFGRRVPPKIATGLTYVFVALILGFFIYVTTEDVKRLWNKYEIPVEERQPDTPPATDPAELPETAPAEPEQ